MLRVLRAIGKVRHRPGDFLKAAIIVVLGLPLFAGGAALGAFFLLPLPAVVPNPQAGSLAQTSRVFAADGSLIATFHAEHNRELIRLDQMSKHLMDAAIASEDARFYEHAGIDMKAIGRAFVADVKAGATVQGGSTITQQYVKNAYLNSREKTLFRKVREALLASQLERTFSKKKILKDYLNTVYLGKGAYGVQAAAKTYFGKPASDVTLSEAAMLVGLIPSPVSFSPYEYPDKAEARRLEVLDQMVELGRADVKAAETARAEKPKLASIRSEILRYPWFVDALLRDLMSNPRYGEGKVFTGGLQIYTTIDPRIQQSAEDVLKQTLPLPTDPHAALVAVDPKTGYVRAVVGGREYGHETEKFNLAVQARRSPGSAFKTFVLAAALKEGIAPSTRFKAPGKLNIKGWGNACQCVSNFGGSGYGSMNIEQATVKSVNTVYVQLAQRVGFAKIAETAKAMGISERSLKEDEETKNLAISIGGFTRGVTPMEMASAYATLAAGGQYRQPKFTTKITDGAGNVLEEGPSSPVQALDPGVASTANNILKKVVESGTAQRADIERPSAGKTGTSQLHQNAWFVGYTPDLSAAIWMGYKDAAKEMKRVHGVSNVTGGSIPAVMWSQFMRVALEGVPPSEFVTGNKLPEPGDGSFRLPPRSRVSPSPSALPEVVIEEPSPSPEPTGFYTPSPSPSPLCFLLGCY